MDAIDALMEDDAHPANVAHATMVADPAATAWNAHAALAVARGPIDAGFAALDASSKACDRKGAFAILDAARVPQVADLAVFDAALKALADDGDN